MRGTSLFLVITLWMMPMMLNARVMVDADVYGSMPAPANEEETKHPTTCIVMFGDLTAENAGDDSTILRPTSTQPLCSAHREVPHLPPWL